MLFLLAGPLLLGESEGVKVGRLLSIFLLLCNIAVVEGGVQYVVLLSKIALEMRNRTSCTVSLRPMLCHPCGEEKGYYFPQSCGFTFFSCPLSQVRLINSLLHCTRYVVCHRCYRTMNLCRGSKID